MWNRMLVIRLLLTISISLFVLVPSVSSEDASSPITIEPIYPDNHESSMKGYFQLQVEPNQKQTVQVRITNNLDVDQKVIINTANGFTNPVGGMLYRTMIDSNESVLLEDAIKLAPQLNVESEIILSANETVEVPIEISVPDEDSGTILGALRFISAGQKNEETVETEDGSANFIIKTETVHAIAIQLDLPKTAEPSFSLGEAGFSLKGPSAYIEMRNDAQMIQEDISGEYRVEDLKGNQLFSGDIPSFKMAPKTQIQYPFQWNYETLEEGEYTLFVTLNVNGKEVSAEESFTIENEKVEEYVERNQPVVPQGQIEEGIPIWVWIIAGAIVLAGLMYWLGRRK